MQQTQPRIPAEYVVPLNMNKLRGRMLRMPAPKARQQEILLIYGNHSSIEKMYAFAEVLAAYGAVTLPDMPGFGGMDSFYRIGEKPSLDTLAAYLASFIKLRYRSRRLTIVGFEFGFLVVTRMLQLYPELAKKVDLVISVGGFSHHEDFTLTSGRRRLQLFNSRFFSLGLPSMFYRNVALHPSLIRLAYTQFPGVKDKYSGMESAAQAAHIDAEVQLWRENDLRTHMYTQHEVLRVNNCKKSVKSPACHVVLPGNKDFDENTVEQHLRVIFNDLNVVSATDSLPEPSRLATKKEMDGYVPRKLKARLK